MKKLLSISFTVLALAFTACQKENPNAGNACLTFTAGIDAVKTSLNEEDGKGKISWEKGDTITVKDGAGNSATFVADAAGNPSTFSLKSGQDPLGDGPYSATYIGSAAKKEQAYSPGNISSISMSAPSTSSTNLLFAANCGVLKLTLQGPVSIKSIMLKGDNTDLYTLDCGEGVDISGNEGVDFYVALKEEYYKKIYLTNTDGKTCIKTAKEGKEIQINKNQIQPARMTIADASQFDCIYLGSRVDGNPNGYLVCWAECNIGAEHCYEAGYYFQWGDTTGYARVGDKWKPFGNETKPQKVFSSSDVIATEITVNNDAAHVLLGGSWRLPLRTEVEKLVKYTAPNVWHTDYKGTGAKGVEITGNTGAKLFLPAVGYGSSTSYETDGDFYWANNTTYASGKRPGFKIAADITNKDGKYLGLKWQDGSQHLGFPIRPVKD